MHISELHICISAGIGHEIYKLQTYVHNVVPHITK